MGESGQDKTEEPTPHKLREARKKGQVAKSKEITTAFLVLAIYIVFKHTAATMWFKIVSYSKSIFSLIANNKYISSLGFISGLMKKSVMLFFSVLAPLFLANVAVAIAVEVAQVGFLASSETIKPKIENFYLNTLLN